MTKLRSLRLFGWHRRLSTRAKSSLADPALQMPGFNQPLNNRTGPHDLLPNVLDEDQMDDDGFNNLVTHREVVMMRMMNLITDKSDWDQKVFNENITSKWREEITRSGQDVSPKMMDWIFKELQWKAGVYQQKGLTKVFDIGVVKSDTAISVSLRDDLKREAALFEKVSEDEKDYHPGSNQKVVNLIHPSLFPVVFGRTHVLPDRTIGLQDCLSSIGQGTLTPIPTKHDTYYSEHPWRSMKRNRDAFSRKFQWLPCDVELADDHATGIVSDQIHSDACEKKGDIGNTAQNKLCNIKSYINNAHPFKHRGFYDVIERVITAAIPLWDESLTRKHYGGERIPYTKAEYGEHSLPPPTRPENCDEDFDEDAFLEEDWAWLQSRPVIQPEPGEFEAIDLDEHEVVNLQELLAESGLQVIVKLANIELSPENPDYEGGTWHIEGQLNERICATAIYYYDSQNITESTLSFRQRGADLPDLVNYEQDCHQFLQDVYGLAKNEDTGKTKTFQDLGGVSCREGRLLTFPNVVQHRVSPFSLADRSRPGHRKILALFLVDPHRRIISSANVPPQREDWALEAGKLGGSEQLEGQSVSVQNVPSIMTTEEAMAYRLELMEERSVAGLQSKQLFEDGEFSLCEH